jgi:hypothetical protein
MIRGEPANGSDQSREPRLYSAEPVRLDVIRMCADCRVSFVAKQGFDPYGAQNQTVRTTDDYLREREALKRGDPDS